MKKPEILAPAGSMEALKAAVYCGANAVYLGGKEFNARRNADNFSFEELKEAVKFCHERDCKVYQTVNIVMLPGEEQMLLHSLEEACLSGIDALIIQDLGVLSIVKNCCPQMKCHASTQMAVHSLDGVKEAYEMGMDLCVLARELSAHEIEYITKNSPIPIEVFVHGAHCMSVSGQCYLSSVIGERSGNRGLCAQPCRLPFKLGEDTHCLSLKDMSLAKRAVELANMGVASLKIEGRMKRPEYVAAAVTAIKQALNNQEPNLEDLRKVFSRSGFTDGYYTEKRDISMFGIRQKEDVVAANDVLKDLGQLYNKEKPTVPLFGEFFAKDGEEMTFSISDKRANTIEVKGDIAEKAINRATDQEHIFSSLNKTGGTPYYFDDIDIDIDENLMIRASQLNLLRREAIEKLSLIRQSVQEIPFNSQLPQLSNEIPFDKKEIRVRCFEDQLSSDLIKLADKIIIPNLGYKAALNMGCPAEKIIVELPRIDFSNENKQRKIIKAAKDVGIDKVWAGNAAGIYAALEENMSISGGWSLNCTNDYAAAFLKETGVSDIEISPEVSLAQIEGINSINKGIIAYGSLPLMVFRNCPVKARIGCEKCKMRSTLTDRMGIEFPVSCKSSYTEMFNSVPVYLADRVDELSFLDFITLWFTLETSAEVLNILKEYKKMRPAYTPESGHTRGLYYRKVK